jgi:hypothetical protein
MDIINKSPVNKLAGVVTQNGPNDEIKGANYTKQVYMSLIKPPIQNYHGRRMAADMNLTGLEFGKMTVIGLFIKQNPKKKLKWVVQCKCGYYTIRNSHVVRRKVKNNSYDECHRCRYISNLSRNQQIEK